MPILILGSEQWRPVFEQDGFTVIETETRSGALEILQNPAIEVDLLVSSVLPDLSGAKLASEANGIRPKLPIILVAGFADRIGIFDRITVLLEPVTPGQIRSTARTLLS